MNKIYVSIILIPLLLLTSCFKGDSQETLIEKANQGDIKSMIELSNVYEFGATKEGLELYRIWADDIDENANPEDILALTKMFYDHKLAFPNGREIYENLLKLANRPLNKQATLTLLNFYSKYFLEFKTEELESVYIKTATKQDLVDLYNLYQKTNDYYGYINRDRVKAIMVEKGYMEEKLTELEYLKRILLRRREYREEYIPDILLLLSNILKSNDLDQIYEIGLILGNRGSQTGVMKTLVHENTEAFMKKALTLNPTNEIETTATFYLSNLYTKYYKDDLTKQKSVLINADKMGKTQRNKTLVALYDIDEIQYAKNIKNFDKMLNTSRTKAYINIAQIYHYGKGKEPVDIEQAKIWYKKADTEQAKEELAKLNKI